MVQIDLTGHRALVCGASRGIGAETARALAQAGAKVTLVARSLDLLDQVKDTLSHPERHQSLSLDFMQPEQVEAKLKPLLSDSANAPFTILVCNSGGPKAGPLLEAEAENFLEGFKAHVLSNQKLVQLLAPGMKKKEYGRIINIISTSVKMPIPNLGVSNTIRGAVANWAKTLGGELGPFGITVNNVLPGFTATERLDSLAKAAGGRLRKSEEEVKEMWKEAVPARRFAKPQETAMAALFLASPLASYINGVNLPVDGGRTGCL